MPATEKELKFDFSDSSKTDSQKWKLFVKDLLYLVMNTHGPLGSLVDVRTITLNEDSPGDNLWGFTDLQPFTEQFNSQNEKTFLALKDKWFKIQMLVYSNLDSSFLTSDNELINKYSYTAVRARIEQYVTSKSDSDDPVSDDYAALMVQFVPFGSFLLHHLDKKYGVEEATDAISMLIAHDVARNSFKDGSKAELQKWCNTLGTTWFNLQRVAAKHDPEHLASLQSLMVIYNKGGTTWKDWVTNQLHQPDWKDKSIKIADVTKAILQAKSFGHTAQASSGEEKVHFLSRGRGGGQRGARGAREVHVAVEVVVHQAVVLPPILSQRSARRCLVLGRSALLNIVSVRRVSKPLRKVNKRRQITVILVQMLQLKFAVRDTARTRSNVLRMLPDGVMQQKHMRAR